LIALADESTSAEWIVYRGIVTAGSGGMVSSLLPAIQASHDGSGAAASTALFAFTWSFGAIWGITIPVAVFNNQFSKLLYRSSNPAVRALLANGQAYEHADRAFIDRFWGVVRQEIVGVYTDASRMVRIVGAAICGVGFLVVFVEKAQKGIKLRVELKSEYGMKEQKKTNSEDAGVEAGFRFLMLYGSLL
ncbi:hypothetical protein BGZ57DRAFT_752812, partial [Hyaloscypha finlandica]